MNRDRPVRVAINGFGRIGRTILRLLCTARADCGIEVACINDVAPRDLCAYLFEFDSVFGPFPGDVRLDGETLIVGGRRIGFHQTHDLAALDLSGLDVVLECTGTAGQRDVAERGLAAGAASVLVSGPCDTADATVVRGANDDAYSGQRMISNASCTTHALAPLLAVLDATFGVISGHMTTIHCYTGSQPTLDAPRGDMARSRAAALSMVPTTTSATRLVETVLPALAGRITGAAVRVPVASVSAVDLTVRLRERADFMPRLRAGCAASGVIGWTDRPLVSADLRARSESLVLSGPEIIQGSDLTRLFGWYDNEWGFSNRMIDLALRMAASLQEEKRHVV